MDSEILYHAMRSGIHVIDGTLFPSYHLGLINSGGKRKAERMGDFDFFYNKWSFNMSTEDAKYNLLTNLVVY